MFATKVLAGNGPHIKLIHDGLAIIDNKKIESDSGHQKKIHRSEL